MNVGTTITIPNGYGIYAVFVADTGYSAIVLSGYLSYTLVAEQKTGERTISYSMAGSNLTLTPQGDVSPVIVEVFKLNT